MLTVERYDLSEFEALLSPEEAKGISQAFAEDEGQLKEDLKECARKQALSEWYAMQMPPDID